ncbi:hypothetical protein, partial [Pseudomonas syringae group genomosp. 7]|uniref:hypothetical protein n=1 Tax=Pseudomonas syringae group genomosp. 7 TaxID=251699 RepID=UPI0037706385
GKICFAALAPPCYSTSKFPGVGSTLNLLSSMPSRFLRKKEKTTTGLGDVAFTIPITPANMGFLLQDVPQPTGESPP